MMIETSITGGRLRDAPQPAEHAVDVVADDLPRRRDRTADARPGSRTSGSARGGSTDLRQSRCPARYRASSSMSSGRVVLLPRIRLVMDETRMGRVDDPVAGLPRLHAQDDIAEGEAEALVEPAQPLEHVPAHHLARAGDRQVVPVALRRAEHTRGALGRPREDVPDKAEPEHHAGMLDRPIRIQELRADDADRRGSSRPAHQLVEPVRLESPRYRCSGTAADRRAPRAAPALHAAEKLNGPVERHDDAAAFPLQRPVQLEDLRLGAAVVDDDQLAGACSSSSRARPLTHCLSTAAALRFGMTIDTRGCRPTSPDHAEPLSGSRHLDLQAESLAMVQDRGLPASLAVRGRSVASRW